MIHDEPTARKLAGRTLLITGAGSGLGRAAALGCAAQGATVVLLGRTISRLESVYDAIVGAGAPQPAIYPLNLAGATVTDYASLAETLETQLGGLDGLIHCAAIRGAPRPLEHFEPKEWFEVLQTNLNGPWLLTQACIPVLRAATDGTVVSVLDQPTGTFAGAYGVAKAGFAALTQGLAEELEGTHGVRVNAVQPGPMATKLRRQAYPGEAQEPLAQPEAWVNTLIHLSASDSQPHTGETWTHPIDSERPAQSP